MKKIKVAILSCNHGHAPGYFCVQDDPFFELVGVSVEPTYRDKAKLFMIPDIPKYDSDEELYANHPDVEAVIIASANRKHMEQVREAAKRGLHIFSMKIPTFDEAEYDEMIELTEKAGLVFQIELEMRHHAEIYRVKELMESGAIGKPLAINLFNYSHNPIWWRPWQCSPEESFGKRVKLRPGDDRYRGGALADHPHVFDILRYLTGSSFDTVFAEVAPNLRDVETEDLLHVMGRLKNGMIYSLDPSYANSEHRVVRQVDWERYPKAVEVSMSIVGTEGTIISDLYGKGIFSERGTNSEYLASYPESIGLWNKRTQEFYECIRYGKTPTVNLRNHRDSIKTMLAAYDSVTTGKIIKMDEYKF